MSAALRLRGLVPGSPMILPQKKSSTVENIMRMTNHGSHQP